MQTRTADPDVPFTEPTTFPEIYVSGSAPNAAVQGSFWYNVNIDSGKLYIRYDNNWIGIE